ncbi:uncharacterized protein LOC105699310 isoform X2 [Orussus abietinus]|uniref:uncharacterized protein LOC105699310 isoform X2 n=1 Tax=Orussus abietinus TaxID=222816 RepID=UPI000625E72C|nr:uncharacterized protein LOC105699310 isoform X2 [Orussus abietinus]
MGQGTETCTDRPTEVSVIRFVSRNRTIEEIAPKKEIYTCKQRGCGKIFTNQDEYKTHETLEALKIRFICREPGCGEELSDPGSMWRHYQEWHNNETSVFSCPYTSCNSVHATSDSLEEHIESCHRQPTLLPMEPEIICFEGSENVIDEDGNQSSEAGYFDGKGESRGQKMEDSDRNPDDGSNRSDSKVCHDEDFSLDRKNVGANSKVKDYSQNIDTSNRINDKFPKNEDLLITKENFLIKYEARPSQCNDTLQIDDSQEKNNIVFVSGDVTITKNIKNEASNLEQRNQEHRLDLGNLGKIFRSGFDGAPPKTEEGNGETNSNCSEDEEYTPKKQRMSRYKQEPYKCEINGCGKMYKYISHYRHHQESHKITANVASVNLLKTARPKQGKASTVSFFLCKVPGCEMEFGTSLTLYKHFNEVHTNGTAANVSTNAKTGNGSSFRFVDQMFQDDATSQRGNFKTDCKAKCNAYDYAENEEDETPLQTVKKESRD